MFAVKLVVLTAATGVDDVAATDEFTIDGVVVDENDEDGIVLV